LYSFFVFIKYILSNIKFGFKTTILIISKMNNDEILMRLKKHNDFFDSLKDCIEDKTVFNEARRYMILLFSELLKNNIVNNTKKEKVNSKL